MSKSIFSLFLFALGVALALSAPPQVAAQVGPATSCDNIVPDQKNHFDLTSLRAVSPLNVMTNSTNDNGDLVFTTFKFAFCQSLKEACPLSSNPALGRCGQPDVAAVCQTTQIDNLVSTSCDGKFELAVYETISDDNGSGLSVSYHEGDDCAECNPKPVYTVINIYCDVTATSPVILSAVREDPPTAKVSIAIKSIAGCPVIPSPPMTPLNPPVTSNAPVATPAQPEPKGGLSGGSVMLIILFVFVAVYVIGGVLINKFLLHRNGVEVFPNINFWAQLPGLVRDGLRFVTCRSGSVAEYRHV